MPQVSVVAGLVFDGQGRVLIAQRPAGKALAGRWEFPGGKVEPDESPLAALVRELREETGILATDAARVMYYAAVYPARTIWLDVWHVHGWHGEPHGHEGQALAWVEPARLHEHDILEADAPIVAWLARRWPRCAVLIRGA
jgi:8-oxo-dGTP diphosphatase